MKIEKDFLIRLGLTIILFFLVMLSLYAILFHDYDYWGDEVYVEGIITDISPSLINDRWFIINGTMYHPGENYGKYSEGDYFSGYLHEWSKYR